MSDFALAVEGWDLVDVDELRPHPSAVRRGDLDAISESVKANGFVGALVCRRTDDGGQILAGKHRWEVCRSLGIDQVPVLWIEVDDATATRIVLVDNRSSDLASNDLEALEAALGRLEGAGLQGSGYSDRALSDLRRMLDPDAGDDDEGEDEDDGPDWSVVRLVVPPDAYRRFWDLMEDTEGPAHADRLHELLGRL